MKTEQIMELAVNYAITRGNYRECHSYANKTFLDADKETLQTAIEALVQERDAYKVERDQWQEAAMYRAAENKVLRGALETIEMWQSHTSKYSIDYGSNGVRELYRNIARQALTRSKS